MHLIEVLMAGSVFAIASGSSVQLWSATAVRTHQLSSREQLEQQIEQDRIQLYTLWRTALQSPPQAPSTGTSGCTATAAELFTVAKTAAVLPSLHRALHLNPDGQALQIQWTASSDPSIQRNRMVTPAGLGLCGLDPVTATSGTVTAMPEPEEQAQAADAPASDPPLTDSQVEGVSP